MTRFPTVLAVVTLLAAGAGQPLHAQWGGMLDKLQKLSGPAPRMHGFFIRFGYQPGQQLSRGLVAELTRDLGILEARTAPSAADTLIMEAHDCVVEIGNSDVADGVAYTESTVDLARMRLKQLGNDLRRLTSPSPSPDVGLTAVVSLQVAQNLNRAACHVTLSLADAERDEERGWVARIGIFHGKDTRDDPRTDIQLYSIQPNLEYRFVVPDVRLNLGIEMGVNLHYFYGGGIDAFLHPSFPLFVNYHPFPRHKAGLLRNMRIGYGVHVFAPFDADAFNPALPDIEDKWEVVALAFPKLSIDISWSSWPTFLSF